MEIVTDYYHQDLQKFLDTIDFKDKTVLDIGCGDGDKSVDLVRRGAKVYGCDIKDVRKAENMNLFSFSITDSGRLVYEDNFFDIVINYDVLEHVENDLGFINEIYRVLKPGGVTYILTPNLFRIGRWARILTTGKLPVFPMFLGTDEILGDCIHLREYTHGSLVELFKKSDFGIAEVRRFWLGLYHAITVKYRITYPPHFLECLCQTLIARAEKSV